MNLKNKVNIHNRFDIEVRDSKTGLLKKSLTSYNIVLNQMYTRLCGGLSYFVNIHFGSSTGTLSATRTSLFSHLGTKAAVNEEIVKAIQLSIWKRKIVLNPEEFVGSTISEVGIAFGATNTNLVTHSLLKDSEGNPISIVKTDTDVITIYATVFVTFDDSNPNLIYLGMPSSNALVNYLIGGGSAPTGTFRLSDTHLAKTRLGSTANATWVADTANKQRKTNVLRFGTTVGNGQVKFLEFENLFSLEFPYSSVFNGQSYVDVSLGVGDGIKKEFLLPSANVKAIGMVIKLNGVQTNDFVADNSILGGRSVDSKINISNALQTQGNGVCLSNDGSLLVVATYGSPYIRIYSIQGETFSLMVPNVYPSGYGYDVKISDDNSTIFIAHGTSPYVTVYDLVSGVWTKRNNPSVLPTSGGYEGRRLWINSSGTIMVVGHSGTPFVSFYDWVGSDWVKRPNLNPLPNDGGFGLDLSLNATLIAVGRNQSPYINTYDWDGSSWLIRPTPSVIPNGFVGGVSLSEDGLWMALISTASPYLLLYFWNGSSWVSQAIPSTTVELTAVKIFDNGNKLIVSSRSVQGIKFYQKIDGVWTLISSTVDVISDALPRGFSYVEGLKKIVAVHDSNNSSTPVFSFFDLYPYTLIKFNTPPAIGDVITADYTVDGVHKTDQYVIDVSFAIQFGEGS